MPSLPLRIAILECDIPLDRTRAKYGGFGGVFKAFLNAGANALENFSSSDLQISIFDVFKKQEYPSLAEIDAILITGAKYDSFANEPWILKLVDFTAQVLKQRRVRIIGVCFGHQIVGRAMGAKVGRSDKGWEISVLPIHLTPKGQEIFRKSTLVLHQMHKDIVFDYPTGVEGLAYTEKCAVQSLYVPQRVITVQGHPEMDEEIMTEILRTRHAAGIFSESMFEEAIGRVGNNQDGVVVSQAFLRFLLD